ncbi:MAG: PQQ-binding-like beta-propeller repeat protein [Fidelibacterota bacterium]
MKSLFHLLVSLIFFFPWSFLLAQNQPLRFCWLSDIHVGSPTGAKDLSQAVHDINGLSSVGFILISGDVTEMGKNSELELAKGILDSLIKPYYIIPGNHDTKWSASGFTKFSQLWGNDKFEFEYGDYRFIGIHQGPLMRMGDGHFTPEDLRWLDSLLTSIQNIKQPLIFVTHYPLDSSIDNWYELVDRAKQHNTQVVLVGHGHRNRALNFEGIHGVMGRSLLRQEDIAGGYTLVEIQNDSMFFYERLTGIRTKSAWHSLSLDQKDYLSEATPYERPDFSINQEYPNITVKWTFETDYTIASAPTVGEGYVVIGNRGGVVYGISLSEGKELWRFATGESVYSTPDISDGKVVFGSSDRNIYCLDVKNGNLLWQMPTELPVVAAPTIVKGVVYIGGSDGNFRAIDLEKGQLIWEFRDVGDFVETKPLIYKEKVIFGAWDTFLYALNTLDGTLAWKWSNDHPALLYSPAACWPVGSSNKVFIVAPDRYMTAIDIETGKTIWRTNRHSVRETIGISEDGSSIYSRCIMDTLLAFSSSSTTPQLLWSTSCKYSYDIDPSMPMEKDGVIFFGTKNGLVIAVDADTGIVKWIHRTGVALVNTVAPIDSNRVVITDMDGRVMMLVEDDH